MNIKIYFLLSNLMLVMSFAAAMSMESESSDEAEDDTKPAKSNGGFASLVAFKPFGKQVSLGLDFLLPFVKVPTKRKLEDKDNSQPLVTINTASITLAGMLAGMGLFVGHILKSLATLRGRSNDEEDAQINPKTQSIEHRLDFEMEGGRFARMLEPIKLVYRNKTGGRVDLSVDSLLTTIEDSFFEKNVDLPACLQRSLCLLVHQAYSNVEKGSASGIEKIIESLSQVGWLMSLIHDTALEEAVRTGKAKSEGECELKYPSCKLDTPEQHLLDLLFNRVKFT